MAADKDLALKMVDSIEQLAIENQALSSVMKALHKRLPPMSEIESLVKQAAKNPLVAKNIRQQCAELREWIQNSPDLSEMIQEFLRIVPAKKDLN